MHRKPIGIAAATAAVALAAVIAVPVMSGAETPTARTITFQEDVPRTAIDDLAPRSRSKLSRGDRLVLDGSLFDTSRKRLGSIAGTCTALAGGKSFEKTPVQCFATYALADGQIEAMGRMTLAGVNLAIVGGTGAYVGAHGAISSGKPAKGFDSADVLTIGG